MRPTSFPRTGSLTALFQSSGRTEIQSRTAISEKARPKRTQAGSLGRFPTAAVLCLALLLAADASAQQATAKILGTVTDQQGLLVPDVKVTVTNTATNVSSETTTDKYGFYQVFNLPIGTYKITASHEGFRTMERTTAPLEINQALRVDLKLQVGTVSEKVLVEGQAEAVETVNPTIGQSVTSRPIVNMPLNGRNVLDLALLQPGVSEDNPDDSGQGRYNIGGGRADSVTFLLDGGINNELLGNGVVLNPNPDTVEEFRILTSNYTAEYGRNGAGVISVVTKSGTNQFHGSAFDFARNTAFDANSYFNKDPFLNPVPLPRNDLKRQQFGGTFGGPITIPHLIEGKDRFFFFVAYQGQRQTQTLVQTTTAFTQPELGGDFSHAVLYDGTTCLNPAGCPDPNVAAFLQTNTYFQSDATKAANAQIDHSMIDPAAWAYIKLGLVPSTTNPNGTLTEAGPATDNSNEFTGKVDFNFSAKDKLSITIGGSRNPVIDAFAQEDNTVTGFPSENKTNNYFLNVGYTRTFSPTLLNEFRVTAQRHNRTHDVPTTNLQTGAELDFGILSDLPNGPPSMLFDNGLTFGTDYAGPANLVGNTFAYTDALTWVRGRSTWKLGAGFSAYQNNTIYDYYGDGQFTFVGPYSAGGIGTGNSLADFLVGIPNNFFEGPNAANNLRSKATYGFAQDEWRLRKNFTLTLGIRYEYSTPKLDTQGRTFSLIPGAQSTRFPNAPLGLIFPGDKGAPRGVNFPDRDNFAPRFGFAWDPRGNGKLSIRGGVGIFYDVLKGEDNLQFNGAPPFYTTQYTGTYPVYGPYTTGGGGAPYYSQPWTSANFPSNPFPSTPPTATSAFNTTPGDPNYGNSLPFGGFSIYLVDPHLHTPYTYQYNLSIQDEVARNLTFELNYVGSSSKGLTSLIDVDPFDLSTVNGTNPARILNEQQTNPSLIAYCSPTNLQAGPAGCPFQNTEEFANISFANFNSLEASLTKQNGTNRIIGNTYFTLGYTYAHSIDNASGFRNRSSNIPYYNHGVFRASSDFDLTHRITFSGGWDLPFDKMWAGPKRLVKGWSLYPIFSWRTGFPLSISSQWVNSFSPADPGTSGAGDLNLANAVFTPGFNHITIMNPRHTGSCFNPNGGVGNEIGNLYFSCAAFQPIPDVLTPNDPYGLPRNFFRGPGRTNLDMTLAKTTAITERLSAEFRVDTFNLFNHAEFDNPTSTNGLNLFSTTFGQITDTDTGVGGQRTERIVQLALRLTF